MPTYTSSTLSVSDGDITTHDTTNVKEGIAITNAECRWRGIETTSSSIEQRSKVNSTTESSGSLSRVETTYPSFNGFNFEEHSLDLDIDGDGSGYEFTYDVELGFGRNDFNNNGTGDVLKFYGPWDDEYGPGEEAAFITADNDAPLEVTIRARTVYDKQVETTYQTEDPFVTRDVDGSYSGTVQDGNWSSWVTLNGVSPGINEFYHNISGSGEAEFEFRYDYESVYPTAVDYVRVGDNNGTKHRVILADPSDSKLDYNQVRCSSDGNGNPLCMDVVDPSNTYAISDIRIGIDDSTVVSPRSYDTV